MALSLVVLALLLSAFSGVPGLFLSKSGRAGQRIAVGGMVLSSVLGLGASFSALLLPDAGGLSFSWPATGRSTVGLDALSAFFLVPVFLVGGLGSVFGWGYWPQAKHPDNAHKIGAFWGFLVAGMVLLLIGRNAWSFLLGWEIMALSAFFLVGTEDKKQESRRAAYHYLIATHVGTLTLFAFFSLWNWVAGSYDFVAIRADSVSLLSLTGLFFLALFGFGLKAGVVPLHFWLPGAHANAPTQVSAILSGVVLKMGIYGLVRFLYLLPNPPESWGYLLVVVGIISAVLGVVFALAQHDLKRLLAYHSVENIGIILLGLGTALVGRSSHHPVLEVLGLAGCLLHVWNHALFKTLLFFAAGSVIHGAHSKQVEALGGLARRLPFTALMFLLGAVAIVGLPPLNGFVSEVFVFLGLFSSVSSAGSSEMALGLAAPFLALVGALALACFVKVYGAVFLGNARTLPASRAHESPISMKVAMALLATACLVIGLAPVAVAPILDSVIAVCRPEVILPLVTVASVSPVAALTCLAILLATVLALALVIASRRVARSVVTWDCGYAQPTPRMQYTASSFVQSIVLLFDWTLRTQKTASTPMNVFPAATHWHSHVNELILDRVLLPGAKRFGQLSLWVRKLQGGLTQHYVAAVLVTLLVLLAFLVPYREIFALLVVRG